MEVIMVILFVVFALISSSNKQKKGRSADGSARKPATGAQKDVKTGLAWLEQRLDDVEAAMQTATAEQKIVVRKGQRVVTVTPAVKAATPEAQRAVTPAVHSIVPEDVGEGRPMLADEDCAGGSMPHIHSEGHSALADEDCAGGSMEHSHSEGISRSAHARQMAAIDAREEEDTPLSGTLDARALRRAVVMAEVLGKPRALRGFRQ